MKECVLCGKLFQPKTNSQRICEDKHFRNCEVCGMPFEITRPSASQKCCSKECTALKRKKTMIERHGVEYAMQSKEIQLKSEKTSLEKFGVRHPAQSDEIKSKTKDYFMQNYGTDCPFHFEDFEEKRKSTCLEKYGVEHPMQVPEQVRKMQSTNEEKYGGPSPICSREVRKRISVSKNNPSNLEKRLFSFLEEYSIEYIPEQPFSSDEFTHSFDVYLPKYRIVIDCDGVFYHGYLDDADGKWIVEENDTRRLQCVPQDFYFLIIVESEFEKGIRRLQNMIKKIDSNVFDQNSEIFNWCRSIEFPYPKYSEERLKRDYEKLCTSEEYNSSSLLGISSVRHFHPSIYHCTVGNRPSPYEAWNDDSLLKKCIANRLIYQNDVSPQKVLSGFNISKIAPKVSVFSPALAKYLTTKYLNDFEEIFDPFSGFSGRMIGVSACGKRYVGQDIRSDVIEESLKVKQFHHLDAADLSCKDALTSSYQGEALFTCPPYSGKEIYLEGQKMLSCDDWINICIRNFNCSRYLFVVDSTSEYSDKVVEEIPYKSYFRSSSEWVVCIDK